MADKFKLFISTAGKSSSEIKKAVEETLRKKVERAVETVVESVVDDTLEEATRAIRRKIADLVTEAKENSAERAAHEKQVRSEKIPPRPVVSYSDRPRQSTLRGDEIAFVPEPVIEENDHDREINALIQTMRGLNEVFYNGYMLKQCAELSIIKQGEFLADVADNYSRNSFCGISRPVYGALSTPQLRTYLTWRTRVRAGEFPDTDTSYIMLYCYELMNKIGVISSYDAFARLIQIRDEYKGKSRELDRLIQRWVCDFYVFNDVQMQFPDPSVFAENGELSEATAKLLSGDFSGGLERLMSHSAYNLKGSVFFTEENAPLFAEVVPVVLQSLKQYLLKFDVKLSELICGRLKRDYSWTPFAGAYVNLDRMDKFCTCRISLAERYCIKQGEYALERFAESCCYGFSGYVLKTVEQVLRRRTGFRHKLTPNISMVLNEVANRGRLTAAVTNEEFTRTIVETTERWCDEKGIYPPQKGKKAAEKASVAPPVKVEIDLSELAAIREKSEEIAQKLIVEEYTEEESQTLSEKRSTEDYSERITQYQPMVEQNEALSKLSEEWRALAVSLSADMTEVLAAVRDGNGGRYCREKGLMAQAEYERINEVALECVGDYVIDGSSVVEDYAEDIAAVLSALGK